MFRILYVMSLAVVNDICYHIIRYLLIVAYVLVVDVLIMVISKIFII